MQVKIKNDKKPIDGLLQLSGQTKFTGRDELR